MGGELEDEGSALTGFGRVYRHFHEGAGAAGGNCSWHDRRSRVI